jgi:hypothetical protein
MPRAIDPVTWHLVEEAARAYSIELEEPHNRTRLKVRAPRGAWHLLKFCNQLEPWLFIHRTFIPDYTPDSQYWEFGAELLPR